MAASIWSATTGFFAASLRACHWKAEEDKRERLNFGFVSLFPRPPGSPGAILRGGGLGGAIGVYQ